MNEIIYRDYTENDFLDLIKIIINAWEFDKVFSEKTAQLIAELNLFTFLNTATYSKVALKDNKPIGFLIGRIGNENDTNYMHKKIKETEEKMILSSDGILALEFYKTMKSVNKELYKKSNTNYDAELSFFALSKDCQGLGIGKTLFNEFNNYLKKNNISNFFLYTDTCCNYAFYEHFNMIRKAEKKISMQFMKTSNIDFYLYDKNI